MPFVVDCNCARLLMLCGRLLLVVVVVDRGSDHGSLVAVVVVCDWLLVVIVPGSEWLWMAVVGCDCG